MTVGMGLHCSECKYEHYSVLLECFCLCTDPRGYLGSSVTRIIKKCGGWRQQALVGYAYKLEGYQIYNYNIGQRLQNNIYLT